ncbi:MAG: AI-2E family transporter [Candidatus Gastranaerophilales bacterium]|nr:AI-2E family transporter [Candidatus Gastranaerophilales bacterium]
MLFRNNSNYKHILFLVVVVFAIWTISQIKEIAMLFFGAFVIACSLNPIADKLSKKMPRTVATSIVILVSLVLVLLIIIPVTFATVHEIKTLAGFLPDVIKKIITWVNTAKILDYKVSSFISVDNLGLETTNLAGNLLDKSYELTMGFLDAVTIILSLLMIIFYFVLEKNEINQSTMRLFPPKLRKRAAEIITAIEMKVGGYVFAQVLSMSTVAFFTVLGLSLCKIEYAVLLGIIAGILDIIPIIGPTFALILGIMAASIKGLIWILPTIAIYLIAQWISNQLVRPVVFGKFMQLHPVIVLFSFFIAAQFLGVWGVILAPAIAATLLTLFDELYVKTINAQGKNSDG